MSWEAVYHSIGTLSHSFPCALWSTRILPWYYFKIIERPRAVVCETTALVNDSSDFPLQAGETLAAAASCQRPGREGNKDRVGSADRRTSTALLCSADEDHRLSAWAPCRPSVLSYILRT